MRSTIALLLVATFASPVLAQSTGPAPGGGTGTGPGSTAPGGSIIPTDLDLPLEKPMYVPPVQPPAPVPDDDDRDDPRDEPPPVIYGEEIRSESDTIVYVVDISCSMDWDRRSYTNLEGQTRTGNRMDRAKVEMARSILGLSRNFSFTVIAYDCGTRTWSRELKEANDTNKSSAVAWVNALRPTGATGTGPATSLGLQVSRENKSVVLLTDGAPNCGVPEDNNWYNYSESAVLNAHRRMIRNANTQGATINVFGIAASGSYRTFCQNVAADSSGSYFDVP
ncbi:MAG: VWA domain-containing protein [Planctomycetes bacterium]|nr:VWA domain-containing protein [Planctomycetota bacterium]